jgi:tagatose-1,6-bisphosphate aldolase
MAKYKVRITEYLSRIVEVEVMDEEYAVKVVKDRYHDGEIVLGYDDFDDVEFELIEKIEL